MSGKIVSLKFDEVIKQKRCVQLSVKLKKKPKNKNYYTVFEILATSRRMHCGNSVFILCFKYAIDRHQPSQFHGIAYLRTGLNVNAITTVFCCCCFKEDRTFYIDHFDVYAQEETATRSDHQFPKRQISIFSFAHEKDLYSLNSE